MKPLNFIQFKAEFFKEDGYIVGVVPSLGVSSFGDTLEEARKSLKEAVDLFLEECKKMGTLNEVLEEAGFKLTQNEQKPEFAWLSRKIQRVEEIILNMPLQAAT